MPPMKPTGLDKEYVDRWNGNSGFKNECELKEPNPMKQEQKHTPTCINWNGSLDSDGYGRIQIGKKSRLAHRVAWEKENGLIPKPLVIDHVCRNRACVNVLHMEVVTIKENTLRGTNPPAQNARKKKCVKGHELISSNLRKTKDGGRECSECSRARWRAYSKRKALAKAGVRV